MGKNIIFIATIGAPPPNTTRFELFFFIIISSCLLKGT